MDWQKIIDLIQTLAPSIGATGLVAIVIVAAFLWFLYYFVKNNSGSDERTRNVMTSEEFTKQQIAFNASVLKRLQQLEELNNRLTEENNKLRIEVARLRQDLALMESAHQDLPIPMWLKDDKGVMLSCNKAYADIFLKARGYTRYDYIGNNDEAVWPPHIAQQFKENDFEVLRTGKIFNGYETVLTSDGQETAYHVIKYTRYAGGVKLGIAGIAIPPMEELKRLEPWA